MSQHTKPVRRRARRAPPAPEQTSITNYELVRVVQAEGHSTPREMLLAKRLDGALRTAEEIEQEKETLEARNEALEAELATLREANTRMAGDLVECRRERTALKEGEKA